MADHGTRTTPSDRGDGSLTAARRWSDVCLACKGYPGYTTCTCEPQDKQEDGALTASRGFSGPSDHRCLCFGEDDGRDGSYRPCPPELCEADILVERLEVVEAELARAKQEIAFIHDRGDHLVYRHEWEEFDRWQRWADDQRKEADRYQPSAQEFNDAMEGTG